MYMKDTTKENSIQIPNYIEEVEVAAKQKI